MLLIVIAAFLISLIVTLIATPIVMRRAYDSNIVGIDRNKEKSPLIPELGGMATAMGVGVALLFVISLFSLQTAMDYLGLEATTRDSQLLLSAFAVILLAVIVGFADDILNLRQIEKLGLIFMASLPLMAVNITALHYFSVPFLGVVSVVQPWMYELLLIPLGVGAVANLTNSFAGYNGLEAGLGSIIASVLFLLGFLQGNFLVMILSAVLLGCLLAFLKFNWHPAKVFPDDVGNLLIGAVLATIVIIGGLEVAGAILLLPHIVDFLFFKIPNRLPSQDWWSKEKNGKLYFSGKPIHLMQYAIKKLGGDQGIEEKKLVFIFIGIEILLGLIVLALYWR